MHGTMNIKSFLLYKTRIVEKVNTILKQGFLNILHNAVFPTVEISHICLLVL